MYGELCKTYHQPNPDNGSAPRVRGTQFAQSAPVFSARFSPACTGNSSLHSSPIILPPVQPRVYGELTAGNVITGQATGSAPRVRGTQESSDDRANVSRFSPACTGNSRIVNMPKTDNTVQPRVYGELLRDNQQDRITRGSAPRVRGTRTNPARWIPRRRFSPACTGNSIGLRQPDFLHPVQPRVYGELDPVPFQGRVRYGSAPRVRGTPGWSGPGEAPRRFSPACTGNSFMGLW